ncbi:LysE family transporter [Chloroflexota bacterium]
MLAVISSVVIISLSGVMAPGPMFAVTLAKSYKSPWAGVQISLGHAVVEVPIILAVYYGFARFFENPAVQVALSIAGGGMIIWMGLSLFRVRREMANGGKDLPYSAFVGGMMMTGLNPFFLLWWATVGSMLIMWFLDFGTLGLVFFIGLHWSCDLIWLTIVSVFVYRTRSLWNRRLQEGVFTACSLLLGGFGVWFVYTGLKLWLLQA